jgi:spermidine synthase
MGEPAVLAPALAAFLLSGAAGLLYEMCWIRRSSLVFGSTNLALSTVLAVFFAGLAAGSALAGRLAHRIAHPLRAYAALEVSLAALALLSLPAFGWVGALYAPIHRAAADSPAVLLLARAGLVAVVVFPPALLMGATLPVFCRRFVRDRTGIARSVGLLYGANTLGAAAGCAAAGFLLIPGLGLRMTVMLGAALNLVSASIAWWIARFAGPESDAPVVEAENAWVGAPAPRRRVPARSRRPANAAPDRAPALALGVLVFLVGFVALGYEIVWTRFLGLVIRNTIHTYTLTLSVVLAGIVIGSVVPSRSFDRVRDRAWLFGALQVTTGLVALALLLQPPAFWRTLPGELPVVALLMLPAAILSGASLPLAVRMAVADPAHAAAGVGRLVALNTAGGITGSLLTGFLLVPVAGLAAASVSLTGASVAAGVVAWLVLDGAWRRPARVAAAVAAGVAWLATPAVLGTRLPHDFLAEGAEVLAVREGRMSNLAVVRNDGVKLLEIDRLWQGQDARTHQVVAGHLPMLLHPNPRRVLVVGVGAGQTPSRMTLHGIERLDAVDIEPAVFDLIRAHFDPGWLDDPRVRAIDDDGRSFVAHARESYDVISLELGQPFRPGVGAFYTTDFYRLARARLAPGGLLSQFVSLSSLPPASFARVVATFLDVFPEATLWYNTSEVLLVGTAASRFEVSLERFRHLDPRVSEDLEYAHWGGPEMAVRGPSTMLGAFLMGPRGLHALADGATPYRDDHPALEYETRESSLEQANDLAAVAAIERHLDDVTSVLAAAVPSDTLARIAAVRRGNLGQIAATALVREGEGAVRRGDLATAESFADRALAANAEGARVQRLKGVLLEARGDDEGAATRYAEALRLREDYAPVHRALGLLRYRQGRVAEAVPHLQASLARVPDDPELHNVLGAALGVLERHDEALASFEHAVRLRPDYAEARANLSRARAIVADLTRHRATAPGAARTVDGAAPPAGASGL